MRRRHALLISTIVGAAAIFGLYAATDSVRLGRSSGAPTISAAEIAAQNRALDRTEANLRRLLTGHPATGPASTGGEHRVIYVRPAPQAVTLGHGEHEGGDDEHQAESPEDGRSDD